MPRTPTHMALLPAATATALPCAGSGTAWPSWRWDFSPIGTSDGAAWLMTHSLPKPAASPLGSPTRGL